MLPNFSIRLVFLDKSNAKNKSIMRGLLFWRCVFFVFCLFVTDVSAQALLTLSHVDSLLLSLQKKESDSMKYVRLQTMITRENDSLDYDLKIKAAVFSFKLAQKSKNKKQIAHSAFHAGRIFFIEEDMQNAKYYLTRAIDNVDFVSEANLACKIHLLLADVDFELGEIKDAYQNSHNGLDLSEEAKDSVLIAAAYSKIGDLNLFQNDYISAIGHYTKSRNIAEELKNEYSMMSIYHKLGKFYLSRNEHSKAMDFFQKSVNLCAKDGDSFCFSENYLQIGRVFVETGKYENALIKFLKALYIQEKARNKKALKVIIYETAQCYLKLKKYDLANDYLLRAYKISNDAANKEWQLKILKSLATVNDSLRNFQVALKYFEKYSQMKDSVFTQEKLKSVAEVEARFKNHEKETENDLLRKEQKIKQTTIENQWLLVALFLFLLLFALGVAWVIFRANQKSKFINKLLNDQKKDIEHKNLLLENQSDQIKKKNIELIKQNEAIFHQKEELASTNTVKDKLFSIISHDFRSPLNSLQGALTIIQMGLLTEQETKKIVTDLKNQLDLTLNLLDNLLNWAKAQMQGIEINPRQFNLQEVIAETVALLQTQAQRKEIEVIQHYFGESEVIADVRTIELVVRNLLANGIKFTPKMGKITITATTDEHEITVSVADNGVGIPPDVLKNMFKENQSNSTLGTSNEKGTGLGLQLCKNFIEKNGGNIRVDSEIGIGSKFTFSIPVHQKPNKLD